VTSPLPLLYCAGSGFFFSPQKKWKLGKILPSLLFLRQELPFFIWPEMWPGNGPFFFSPPMSCRDGCMLFCSSSIFILEEVIDRYSYQVGDGAILSLPAIANSPIHGRHSFPSASVRPRSVATTSHHTGCSPFVENPSLLGRDRMVCAFGGRLARAVPFPPLPGTPRTLIRLTAVYAFSCADNSRGVYSPRHYTLPCLLFA